jgi:hypothetical protein
LKTYIWPETFRNLTIFFLGSDLKKKREINIKNINENN